MFIIYSISLSSHTKFLFYVYFMLTVAPGGNNLATICYKDFLGLATINMYYYYYYSCSHGLRTFARDLAMQSRFPKHVSALFFLFFVFVFSFLSIMYYDNTIITVNFSFFSFPSDLLLIKTVIVVSSSCYCCNSRWSAGADPRLGKYGTRRT